MKTQKKEIEKQQADALKRQREAFILQQMRIKGIKQIDIARDLKINSVTVCNFIKSKRESGKIRKWFKENLGIAV